MISSPTGVFPGRSTAVMILPLHPSKMYKGIRQWSPTWVLNKESLLLAVGEMGAGVHVDTDHGRRLITNGIEVMLENDSGNAQQIGPANAVFQPRHGWLAGQRAFFEGSPGGAA